jgi:putative resolvase
MKLISIGKASKILGVTPKTLRVWEKNNKIDAIYTPNGHRRYNYDYLITKFNLYEKTI